MPAGDPTCFICGKECDSYTDDYCETCMKAYKRGVEEGLRKAKQTLQHEIGKLLTNK